VADRGKPGSEVTQDEHYELPQGWVWASLGTVCVVNPRHERDALPNEASVSFIPMAAVDQQSGSISGSVARPYGEVRKGFTHFGEGDVLFARITPCMENGKIAVARDLVNGLGCGTTEFHVLRPLGGILPEYIYRYLRQESFRRTAAANMSGTAGQLRVPTDYIRSVRLPLAPLAEQRRIVAKIEALFEQSRTARQALDRIPPLLKKFRQSVLAAAFRGDLTRDWREQHPDVEPASVLLERIRAERRRAWEEDLRAKGKDPRKAKYEELRPVASSDLPELPEGWVWSTMDEVTCRITSGSRAWKRRCGTGTATFILSQNVRPGFLDFSNRTRVDAPCDSEAVRTRVEVGDILVTIVGNTGETCMILEDPGEAYVCQSVALIRPIERLTGRWFGLYLESEQGGQRQFRDFQYGMGRAHLGLWHLRQTLVPLAPLDEQFQITGKIDELLSQTAGIEKAMEKARRQAEKLEQSILALAFRGELVPPDPNDEPASTLLDRIRQQHLESMTRRGRRIARSRHKAKKASQQAQGSMFGRVRT